MTKDETRCLLMHLALLEFGILTVPITYPGVKKGEERLRINITRGHTYEDIDRLHELLVKFGTQFGVVDAAA